MDKKNTIIDILDVLKTDAFYGSGKYTEIAKGKYEFITNFKDCFYKIKRIFKSKK